jgi:hypothetical protein
MIHITEKDFRYSTPLGWRPVEEWEGADDLQSDFPFVAICKRAYEDFLIWSDPVRMIVCQLFKEVQRSHRYQPIIVLREGYDLGNAVRLPANDFLRVGGLRQGTPIPSGQQHPNRLGSVPSTM